MTAKEAVNRSISHDEIVTIHAADRFEARVLVSQLQAIAFDAGLDFSYTLIGRRYETWAPKDGPGIDMVWRVHVEVEAQ